MTGCWIEFDGKGDDVCASSPFLFIFPPFTTCSMPFTYAMPMNMKWNSLPRSLVATITAALALSVAIPAADAGNRRDEQDAARRAMLDGQVMPFAMIKRRVDAAARSYGLMPTAGPAISSAWRADPRPPLDSTHNRNGQEPHAPADRRG
jgi:hypothetical protein